MEVRDGKLVVEVARPNGVDADTLLRTWLPA
jgi:hypothetical protein